MYPYPFLRAKRSHESLHMTFHVVSSIMNIIPYGHTVLIKHCLNVVEYTEFTDFVLAELTEAIKQHLNTVKRGPQI